MANVRDADLAKTIGRNITDFRERKTHDSEPNMAVVVNIVVNTQILRWVCVGCVGCALASIVQVLCK